MPSEPGSYAHCLVLPNPVGPGYLFTVSEDEHVHARLEIDFAGSSWSGQRLAEEVGPVLAQLKREGKQIGLQVPDDAYLVGYVIAGALGGLIDGYGVPEAVHVEVALPDPAEANTDVGGSEPADAGTTTALSEAGSEGSLAPAPPPATTPETSPQTDAAQATNPAAPSEQTLTAAPTTVRLSSTYQSPIAEAVWRQPSTRRLTPDIRCGA
jgi:hypothetical protein